MRSPFTLILLALVAVLVVLTALRQVHGDLGSLFGESARPEHTNLFTFETAEVAKVTLAAPDGTQGEFRLENGVWIATKPWEDVADARVIQSLIDFSQKLRIEDRIPRDEVEDLANYGLESARIEVELADRDGKALSQFHIGRNTSWRYRDSEDNNFPTVVVRPTGSFEDDFLYVCADQADPRLRQVGIRNLFDIGLKRFRDHQVFYFHPRFASEIILQTRRSSLALEKTSSEPKAPWLLTKPFELAADPDAVKTLIGTLGSLSAIAVVDPATVTLPPATEENIGLTITAVFAKETEQEKLIRAQFFRPLTAEDRTIYARVSMPGQAAKEGTELKLRSAILRIPTGPDALLTKLPRGVNDLRSRTLTSLSIRQLESLTITDNRNREVNLDLQWNPHERAKRWHATSKGYRGPANEEQVALTFEVLFQKPVLRFVNDAASDLAPYGLADPERVVELTLEGGKSMRYLLGRKTQQQHFLRFAGQPYAVSLTARAAKDPANATDAINKLRFIKNPELIKVEAPELLGFDGTRLFSIPTSDGETAQLELGVIESSAFYSTKEGSNRVAEVAPSFLDGVPTAPYRWREARLWNIDSFEVRGMVIKRRGEPDLNLKFNYFRQQWQAEQEGQDISPRLNTNKANRLLEKIAAIRVQKWLGPPTAASSDRLAFPDLEISVLIEEVDATGAMQGLRPQTLAIASAGRTTSNRVFLGRSSTVRDLFLLDLATVQGLAVGLIE